MLTILRLISGLPRAAATFACILLLAAGIGLPTWLNLQPGYALGFVEQTAVLNSTQSYVRVRFPLAPAAVPVIVTSGADAPVDGDWLIVAGHVEPIADRPIMQATAFSRIPIGTIWRASPRDLVGQVAANATIAVLAGCLVLIAGSLLAAGSTALVFGGVGAGLAWHAALAAAFEGWETLPPFALHALVLVGTVVGLSLGWRGGRSLGSVWQRLVAAGAIYALLPLIDQLFGWPEIATWLFLVAALALPVVASALLGGSLLVMGLHAEGNAALAILAVSCVAALATQGANGWVRPRRRIAQLRPGRFTGAVPLSDLLGHRS
jgi:hypothetical protein